jgi:hypothetical protein
MHAIIGARAQDLVGRSNEVLSWQKNHGLSQGGEDSPTHQSDVESKCQYKRTAKLQQLFVSRCRSRSG